MTNNECPAPKGSFPNAELGEDAAQDFLGGDGAGDLAQGVQGLAEFRGQQFRMPGCGRAPGQCAGGMQAPCGLLQAHSRSTLPSSIDCQENNIASRQRKLAVCSHDSKDRQLPLMAIATLFLF